MTRSVWKYTKYPKKVPGNAAFCVMWGIDAPGDHVFWSQYIASLVDLTSDTGGKKPILLKPNMTHEFLVWATDPKYRIPRAHETCDMKKIHLLYPANIGYQFQAESDEAAEKRIQGYMDEIVELRLSPDTDRRSATWGKRFADGYSLVRSWGE